MNLKQVPTGVWIAAAGVAAFAVWRWQASKVTAQEQAATTAADVFYDTPAAPRTENSLSGLTQLSGMFDFIKNIGSGVATEVQNGTFTGAVSRSNRGIIDGTFHLTGSELGNSPTYNAAHAGASTFRYASYGIAGPLVYYSDTLTDKIKSWWNSDSSSNTMAQNESGAKAAAGATGRKAVTQQDVRDSVAMYEKYGNSWLPGITTNLKSLLGY